MVARVLHEARDEVPHRLAPPVAHKPERRLRARGEQLDQAAERRHRRRPDHVLVGVVQPHHLGRQRARLLGGHLRRVKVALPALGLAAALDVGRHRVQLLERDRALLRLGDLAAGPRQLAKVGAARDLLGRPLHQLRRRGCFCLCL